MARPPDSCQRTAGGPGPLPACVGSGGRIRIICVAKFANAVCVLAHCQQNTEKTSNVDLDLAAKRYRGALKEPGQ
ncbi:type II toxin-antitoxin system RelE/ParE family toxin [Verminephrobacter eiseniae]|uniref:type II toxin-antitoxin system RelE/ParE family toxin n=1 Tax=Verminephrobacter eiseniae TaxID=364317 RepID=UPI0022384B6F|nr:type II toxin-antitoxin system RelE/ParE family toxin [Verminephrobacter eiseniae]